MLQLWTCEACRAPNEIIVSLLAPPPDTVKGECRTCGHAQRVPIPDGDQDILARQRRRKLERFTKVVVLTS